MKFKTLKLFLTYSSCSAVIASGLFFNLCRNKSNDFSDFVYEFSEDIDDDGFLVAAHRGHCDNFVENTSEAFANAADSNLVDFIEIDVRLTDDDELVVVHNNSVTKVDGNDLRISSSCSDDILNSNYVYFSADDLKNFLSSFCNDSEGRLIRERFHSTFGKNYCIPSLKNAFDKCGGKPILLDLKFKNDFDRFEKMLFKFLDSCSYDGEIILQSADLESLKKLQCLHPEYSYLAIVNSEDDFEKCDSFNMLGVRKNLVGHWRTIDALYSGKRISVWTINSSDELSDVNSSLGKYGDDVIYVTDYPKMISAVLSKTK